ASLIAVGLVVLALRVAIPERVGDWLEFGVALMIIGLGASAFVRALRGRPDLHTHEHQHDGGAPHAHVHFHEGGTEHTGAFSAHSHAVRRIGVKPLIVGMVHGLAGSAALTLLVLAQVESAVIGLLFLAVFGVGSIVGMLLMSGLIGLPFTLTSRNLTGAHQFLQVVAGGVSLTFGLWYAYESGVASGFWRPIL
ncbi:MAG: hypothetical protein ACRD68_15890, partial [Pyrinomonadaceae bacterium]